LAESFLSLVRLQVFEVNGNLYILTAYTCNMRKTLIILSFLLASLPMHAQFIFENLRWEDGLSAKEVRCLYRDDDGYLWIGTSNGLNRFDGAVVLQYKNTRHLNSLYINAIQPLNTDSLLIGCRLGVRVFNKKTGAFTTDNRFAAVNNEIISSI